MQVTRSTPGGRGLRSGPRCPARLPRSSSGGSTSTPPMAPFAPRARSAPRSNAAWRLPASGPLSKRSPRSPLPPHRDGDAAGPGPMEPSQSRRPWPRRRHPPPSLNERPARRAGGGAGARPAPPPAKRSTSPAPPTCLRPLRHRLPARPLPPDPPDLPGEEALEASSAACEEPRRGLPVPRGTRSPGA